MQSNEEIENFRNYFSELDSECMLDNLNMLNKTLKKGSYNKINVLEYVFLFKSNLKLNIFKNSETHN